MRFSFSDYLLDLDRRELRRLGEPVRLPPKVFALLEYLVRQQPKAISKEELLEHIWPEPFVSEANLSGLVADLRSALEDHAREPRYVRTVHGFGYSWVGGSVPIAELAEERRSLPASALTFRILLDRQEIDLVEGMNILGREPGVIVWIDDLSVSRRHARIRVEGDLATLEDLESKNGTFLRGQKLSGPSGLGDGDEIKIGNVKLRVRVFRHAGATQTSFET
jgi:DNA-binding winged helix-turn-helix (wHTH) protein